MLGLEKEEIEQIKSALASIPEVSTIILFGSRAMGNHKKGSDVDLALKGNLNLDSITKAQYLLNETLDLPYFFDIIHYDTLKNNALITHIDTYGKIL